MITAFLHTIASAAKGWATVYGGTPALSTSILFMHLGGLLVAGGSALYMDWKTLELRRASQERQLQHLEDLASVHVPVLGGLAVVLVSGTLLFLSDVQTYGESATFWVKTILVVGLLANGAGLKAAGNAAHRLTRWAEPSAGRSVLGARLPVHAALSLAGWMAISLLGVILSNT